MKKNVKVLSLMLALVVIMGTLVACGNNAQDNGAADKPAEEVTGEDVTLVYAEVNPLDSIAGETAIAFKEKLEELSGGQITVDIQANGVLGSENDYLDTMLGGAGTIDMARVSAFQLTNYGGAKAKLLSLPYTFADRDHFWKFAKSDLATEILEEPHENGMGVRGLWYGEEGFRSWLTRDAVGGIEDLKNMKLRSSNDPVMNAMIEGMGAYPTVVSFGELYSALQTGVVDGAEQPIVNYRANAFQEVAPNMILNDHTLGAYQIIITDAAFDGLTEEQQAWVVEAGEYAAEVNEKVSIEKEQEVLDLLIEDGVNIVEVEDKTPWIDAVKPVIEKEIDGYEDLYQQILDLK